MASGSQGIVVCFRRDDKEYDLDATMITADTLQRVFRVDGQRVWLRKELDGKAFFPDHNGEFNLRRESGLCYCNIIVEGPPLNDASVFASGGVTPITISTTWSQSMPPVFRPGTTRTHNARVVLADMEKKAHGKVSFTEIGQTFIPIIENQANVPHILQEIRKVWVDYDNLQLVTNDGLPLNDSEGTRGLKFWKSGRRKVYAVNIDSNAQDARGGSTNKKRKRPLESIDEDHETQAMFTELREDVHEIKETICDILQVSSFQKVPVGLQQVLVDAFKCKICTQLSQPPIVIMKCCKVILGCSNCCKEWFYGEDALTKFCPLCRAERGYGEVMTLRGLDDLLVTLRQLWERNDLEASQAIVSEAPQ